MLCFNFNKNVWFLVVFMWYFRCQRPVPMAIRYNFRGAFDEFYVIILQLFWRKIICFPPKIMSKIGILILESFHFLLCFLKKFSFWSKKSFFSYLFTQNIYNFIQFWVFLISAPEMQICKDTYVLSWQQMCAPKQ